MSASGTIAGLFLVALWKEIMIGYISGELINLIDNNYSFWVSPPSSEWYLTNVDNTNKEKERCTERKK